MKKLEKSLIRVLLRSTSRLSENNIVLYLRKPPVVDDPRAQTCYSSSVSYFEKEVDATIGAYFPNKDKRIYSGQEMRNIIVDVIRSGTPNAFDIDLGFRAIRFLTQQTRLASFSTLSHKYGLDCLFTPLYCPNLQIGNGGYPFYYQIIFHNQSDQEIQILGRYWNIESETDELILPKYAPGIVGLTPIIRPNETLIYTSHIIITSSIGTMKGGYLCKILGLDKEFDLPIKKGTLSTGNVVGDC